MAAGAREANLGDICGPYFQVSTCALFSCDPVHMFSCALVPYCIMPLWHYIRVHQRTDTGEGTLELGELFFAYGQCSQLQAHTEQLEEGPAQHIRKPGAVFSGVQVLCYPILAYLLLSYLIVCSSGDSHGTKILSLHRRMLNVCAGLEVAVSN